MKFSPLDQVYIMTPAALLVGVVLESRAIERHNVTERTYLVRHLDNVSAIAEMVCTEEQLMDRSGYSYYTPAATKWLETVGQPAAKFCDDYIAHLQAAAARDAEAPPPPALATTG